MIDAFQIKIGKWDDTDVEEFYFDLEEALVKFKKLTKGYRKSNTYDDDMLHSMIKNEGEWAMLCAIHINGEPLDCNRHDVIS